MPSRTRAPPPGAENIQNTSQPGDGIQPLREGALGAIPAIPKSVPDTSCRRIPVSLHRVRRERGGEAMERTRGIEQRL
ncbi:MAG: hypothetical protein GY772_27415 [bacterium]|nr:hypothetical protein [bacterium]